MDVLYCRTNVLCSVTIVVMMEVRRSNVRCCDCYETFERLERLRTFGERRSPISRSRSRTRTPVRTAFSRRSVNAVQFCQHYLQVSRRFADFQVTDSLLHPGCVTGLG
jgi:hypothetical protein